MLVLSRYRNESIMIGEDVEIMIVDIRDDRVQLGINAPRSIPIHRKEVYKAIQRRKLTRKMVAIGGKRQRLYKLRNC